MQGFTVIIKYYFIELVTNYNFYLFLLLISIHKQDFDIKQHRYYFA